jgi:hypothetical protein
MGLKYHWKGIKIDDSELDQYTDDEENPFQNIVDACVASELKEFRIYEQNETTPTVYCVTGEPCKFYKGTEADPHATDITPGGIVDASPKKLVFIRRNQIRLDENGHVVDPPRTTYILGFKIGDVGWTMDIRAKVGVLPEEVIDARETNEEPMCTI